MTTRTKFALAGLIDAMNRMIGVGPNWTVKTENPWYGAGHRLMTCEIAYYLPSGICIFRLNVSDRSDRGEPDWQFGGQSSALPDSWTALCRLGETDDAINDAIAEQSAAKPKNGKLWEYALFFGRDDVTDSEPYKLVCDGVRSTCHSTEAEALEYLARHLGRVALEMKTP